MQAIFKTRFPFLVLFFVSLSASAQLSDVARILASAGYYVREFSAGPDDQGSLSVFVHRGDRIQQRFLISLNSSFGLGGLTFFSGNGFLSGSNFREVTQRNLAPQTYLNREELIRRVREYDAQLQLDPYPGRTFNDPFLYERIPTPGNGWYIPPVEQRETLPAPRTTVEALFRDLVQHEVGHNLGLSQVPQ